jgi:hypothetical protein
LHVSRAQRLSARAVQDKFITLPGPDAIACSIVTTLLRRRRFLSILVDPLEEPPTTIIYQGVLDALKKQPLPSLREPAKLTYVPMSTAYQHLTQSIGFVVGHFCWVPHGLMVTQKAVRLTLSNKFLCQLRSIKHYGWQFIVALDELWPILLIDHECIWLWPEEE